MEYSSSTAHPERLHNRAPRNKHPRARTETVSIVEVPWQHVAQAFSWVAEDQFIKANKRPMKTEEWVKEQQFIFNPSKTRCKRQEQSFTQRATAPYRVEEWEELYFMYGVEAETWMRQEEQARRLAEERLRARIRIQEELRRIEARLHSKRETERREREAERRRVQSGQREKEQRDRAKLDKLILTAWTNYERHWTQMTTSSGPLHFKAIPWPLIIPPRNNDDITEDALAALIFSPLHSHTQSRKDRIRSAQLRWHPDRFRRFIGRVPEKERKTVEEGVGIVARCLNELMEKEKKYL